MKKVLGQISLSPTTKKGTNTLICVGVVSVSPGRVLRPSTDACYWDPLELFETQQSYTCSHWGWRRDTVDGSQIRLSSWFGRHPRFLQRFIDPRWRKISYMKNQEYLDPSWRYLQFCAKLKYMGGREVMCDISWKNGGLTDETPKEKNTHEFLAPIGNAEWYLCNINRLPGLAHSYINPGFAGELSVNHQPGTLENEWLVYFVSLRFWCLLEEVYGATFFWLLFNWWLDWWKKIVGGFPIPFRRKAPRIVHSLKLTWSMKKGHPKRT